MFSNMLSLSLFPRALVMYPAALKLQFKPNSITLASSELAPNMSEAGSCQIPLH